MYWRNTLESHPHIDIGCPRLRETTKGVQTEERRGLTTALLRVSPITNPHSNLLM